MEVHEVMTICMGLESDKVTERKKSADNLLKLFGKSYVTHNLDKATDIKKKERTKGFGWDNVFKAVKGFIRKELEALQKGPSKTAATASKKKQEICYLFKTVIRTTNKNGPRLRVSDAIDHILTLLQDDFACSVVGADYSTVLMKEILTEQKYWRDIPHNSWQGLLQVYCQLFCQPPSGLNRFMTARIIQLLMQGGTRQAEVRPKHLLQFYARVLALDFLRSEAGMTSNILERLVSSLNVLTKAAAASCRTQLCRLGEDVFTGLLYIWSYRPTDTLKSAIIECWQTQICVHHPKGVKTVEKGAFAIDWRTWKNHMIKLYGVLIEEIGTQETRTRFTTGSREMTVKPALIALAADVCHQLFSEETTVLDVTQICSTPSGGAKRRGIEVGWQTITDKLSVQNKVHALPWLRLLTQLVSKYPDGLEETQGHELLVILEQIFGEDNKPEVTSGLSRCLKAVAKVFGNKEKVYRDSVLWGRVWISAVRNISLQNGVSDNFSLLTTLVLCGQGRADKTIWTLFSNAGNAPMKAAVQFLQVYTQSFPMPESFSPLPLVTTAIKAYTLRRVLYDWLLPNFRNPMLIHTHVPDVDVATLANVLVSLTFHDAGALRLRFDGKVKERCNEQATDFERLYLKTAFKWREERKEAVLSEPNQMEQYSQIPELTGDLLKRCAACLKELDSEGHSLETMGFWCGVVGSVVCGLALTGCALEELRHIWKLVIRTLVHKMSEESNKKNTSVCKILLKYLLGLYTQVQSSDNKEVAASIGAVEAEGVLDALLQIVHCKGSVDRSDSHRSQAVMEDDDTVGGNMDDGFDGMDFEEVKDPEEFGATNTVGFPSLLCSNQLTEKQALSLHAASVICCLCSSLHEKQLVKSTRTKLIEIFTTDSWDPGKPYDLQLFLMVMEGLASKGYGTFMDTDVEDGMDALGALLKHHILDHEVSAAGLKILSKMIPHLSFSGAFCSEIIQRCRKLALQLLRFFWKRYSEHKIPMPVCLRLSMADCLQALQQNDPAGTWTFWEEKNGNKLPLTGIFCQLLKDKSRWVQQCTAERIDILFVHPDSEGRKCWKRKEEQESMFEEVYKVLREVLVIQGRLSPDEQQDESVNNIATLMQTLATITMSSPICEKQAVCAVCLHIKEHNIDIELAQKVLCGVSEYLGYRSLSYYLASHLPYIFHQWIELKHNLQDFPYSLLGCIDLADFCRNFCHIIIPCQVMLQDIEGTKFVAETLQEDWKKILTDSLPSIMVHILPVFAAGKDSNLSTQESVRSKVRIANQCYEALEDILCHQTVSMSIPQHLDKIVVDVLKTLHNPEEGDTSGYVPEPSPPTFSQEMVACTLTYLTKCHGTKTKTLVSLLAKTQDSIQNVLLLLSVDILRCHRAHKKLRKMQMYELFIELLMQEFHQQLGGSWAYVLRHTIHSLLHIVKVFPSGFRNYGSREEETFSKAVFTKGCDILRLVCETGMASCPQEMDKYLATIVTTIVPYADFPGAVGEKSLQLLNYLVLDNMYVYKDTVALLEVFPDKPIFSELIQKQREVKYGAKTFTIQEELTSFLSVLKCLGVSNCLESLVHLKLQLNKRKLELFDLMEHPGGGSPTFCEVISELVNLCKSENCSIALEAAACLGEIGPAQLSVTTLPGRGYQDRWTPMLERYQGDEVLRRYFLIFHKLCDYLIDEDVNTQLAASKVLKSILSTGKGQAFCTDHRNRLQEVDPLFHYLHPFKMARKKSAQDTQSQDAQSQSSVHCLTDQSLWLPDDQQTYTEWLTRLTSCLASSQYVQDEVLQRLGPICATMVGFCELVLPYLIHNILLCGGEDERRAISQQITHVFAAHCSAVQEKKSRTTTPLVSASENSSRCTDVDQKAVKVLLNVVQYLRQQQLPNQNRRSRSTPFDNNYWLDLNYLDAGRAALACGAPFSTLLYTEIWWDMDRQQQMNSQNSSSSDNLLMSSSSSSSCPLPERVQALLLEAYRSIGDPDAVYGCGAGQLPDIGARIQTYEHERNWNKALLAYDLEMEQPIVATQAGLLKSLQCFGADHVLDMYLRGLHQAGWEESEEIRELQYQAAWRAGKWDTELPARAESGCGFHQALFTCLKSVKDRDSTSFNRAVEVARLSALKTIGSFKMESVRSVYPGLSKLLCVNLVEKLGQQNPRSVKTPDLLQAWSTHVQRLGTDFEFLDLVLDVQHCLLSIHSDHMGGDRSVVTDHLQLVAKVAREAGVYQKGERCLHQIRKIVGDAGSISHSCQLEEARLFWARGEENIAKNITQGMILELSKDWEEGRERHTLYPQVLGLLGSWLAQTKSESPRVVMEKYLEKVVEALEELGTDDKETSCEAYLALAKFADGQYKHIVNYYKSSTHEAKQAHVRNAKIELEQLKTKGAAPSRYQRTLDHQARIDEAEIREMKADHDRFLHQAIANYIKCLRVGDQHDNHIFRVIGLWFENVQDEAVNTLLEESSRALPPHKFLPLMYQLAARMSNESANGFQPALQKLILQVAAVHPHHTLPIVLALANANRDVELAQLQRQSRKKQLSQASALQEDRAMAAQSLLDQLMTTERCQLIKDLRFLSDAYIQLANFNVDEYKKETRPIKLPTALLITKLKNLECSVLTRDIQIDPSGEYNDVVKIAGFESTFKLAGGVNLPKIINCIGSDGKRMKQLTKGRDDLRQDAVMQQVFGLVNTLLKKDKNAGKHKLHVRTYKVLPLSRRSGLVEWCEGTQPLGEYLTGNQGAHQRYNPEDWTHLQCRQRLQVIKEPKERLAVYMEVCHHFQPVFRHFFLEHFLDPAEWYDRKQAYTRSVATNSIVGYILGLGDRHIHNILIDCVTAELVHIDLGVAFEQGKILPTPETVPFRLTRDIVDGMGITGVEGVFRKSCEKTMEAMHQSQEALLTILQVLLYDPLYIWTISPIKAMALQRNRQETDATELNTSTTSVHDAPVPGQSNTDTSVNQMAERVLLRLEQKLQGMEEGLQLSLKGQVNYLIQQAMDVHNLSRLFPGWMPFM